MKNKEYRYNLRVYAIIRNEVGEILVSDERRGGTSFTKFPGGGLEWGEGTKECLRREIEEELGVESVIGELFYVNDFFQASAFRPTDQLVSFYYEVDQISIAAIPVSNHPIPMIEEGEAFRWVPVNEMCAEIMTFPIDKIVAEKLRRS